MVEAAPGVVLDDVAEGGELGEAVVGVAGDPEVALRVEGGVVGAGHVVGEEGDGERPVVGRGGEHGLVGGVGGCEGEERGDVLRGVLHDVEHRGDGVGGVVVPTFVLEKRLVQPTPTPVELMQGASMSARVLSLARGENPLPSSLPSRAVPSSESTRF